MPGRIVSFKDLTNRKDISVNGTGTFNIGLSLEGSLLVEKDEDNIGVLLLHLLVHDTGGSILCPANKDLTCIVNSSEELTGEINLIDGMRLEIADLTLVFIDGPIPKLRRTLPRTPGLAVVSSPPAKPVRSSAQLQKLDTDVVDAQQIDIESSTESCDNPKADADDDDDREESRWLENSWCMLDLPVVEQGMFKGLDTPEKIGVLVASYFCKQVQIFTDAVVTTKRLDDIFKMCLETVDQCRDVYINYLGNISKVLARVPDTSNTQPMHSPAIGFLTQLLTHSLDPVSRVVLILDLLRTFSHFDANLSTMVKYQTTAAVLGCLAAFLDVIEVQQFAMEILAKIATYRPRLERKAPLRDVGIDLVVRGMLHHGRNMVLARAGCRVLANLSNTLLSVLNHWLDTERPDNDVVVSAVDRCESLLVYVFEKGIPAVQTVLKEFRTDLGVSTEGRRFIFYYAKLPQLQLKKSRWLKDRESNIGTTTEGDSQPDNESELELSNQDMLQESCDHSAGQANLLRKESVPEPDVTGILKYTGCYENRRTGEKRIIFADDTVGGSESESSESEEELVKSLESSVQLDDETKEQMTIKVRHAMRRTIKRQKSFRGEEVTLESETEDSFDEEKSDKDFENTSETGEVKDGIYQRKIDENDTKNSENESNDHVHVVDRELGQSRHDESSEKINSDDTEGDVESNAQSKLEESESVKVCAKLETETDMHNRKNIQHISPSGSHCTLRTVSIDDDFVVIETTEDSGKSSKQESGSTFSDAEGASTLGRSEGMETLETDTEKGVKDRNGEERPKEVPQAADGKETADKSINHGQEKARYSYGQNGTIDVYFFGKLVRTQIIIYVGSLVFQGEDSKVLLIIDQPIKPLLEAAGAPTELVEYAGNQYGPNMTLMDLEPAIVINIIDVVRYRSVTKDLVQSSLLSLTRTINASLQQDSINTVMMLYKTAFADSHLQNVLTDEDFLKEFRICFQKATEQLEKLHSVEEIRQNVAEKSFAVLSKKSNSPSLK